MDYESLFYTLGYKRFLTVIGKGLYAIGNLAIGGVHEHET
jgi:hypothetical protein